MKISIVIFCFNEEHGILAVVLDTIKVLNQLASDYEIIIVNDGSTDSTLEILNKVEMTNPKIKLVSHSLNKGIGYALKTGYSLARFDYVCAIPGDGQFDVDELLILQPFFPNNTFYSFYRPQTDYSFYRGLLSWFNRIFNQHFLGIYLRDVNWIKVYRKEQLDLVNTQLKSSLIESEICAKLYKLDVLPIEIPSKYLARSGGESKGGSWSTVKKALIELSLLWWVVYRFKPSHRL